MYQEYKKYEEQWNQRIKHLANCPQFVHYIKEQIDSHLDQVQSQRKLVNRWLIIMELPTRDEIAHLAKVVIANEDRVDTLEDNLFELVQKMKLSQNSLNTLKSSLQSLRIVVEMEYLKSKGNRIEHLRDELAEVKSLFN